MTEKLFYEDSYLQTFTARVLTCEPAGDGFRIVLDRTAFFPEGGGQYADHGVLGGVTVTDVQEEKGVIYHYTAEPLEPEHEVAGSIDWPERFLKMQQHTGEHIVSGLVHARFGYNNVGFHLGSTDCTMDFDGEISRKELSEIERRANEVLVQNLEVEVSYPTGEELAVLEYRSKIEIEGQVRIITIPGCDVCACCAPHVRYTGEIGQIKLTNVQRYKGGVRVTMLCGFRALADYNRKQEAVRQISAALCAKEDETADAVAHLQEECGKLKQTVAQLQRELVGFKAAAVEEKEGTVCLFEPDMEGDAPRLLMNQILEKGHQICAVFFAEKNGTYRYVIGSRSMDLRSFVRELNEAFAGRGGGKPEMVQGSLQGTEKALRVWIQEKVRTIHHE